MAIRRTDAQGCPGRAHRVGRAWIGIDVVMGVVIFTALLAEDDNTRALATGRLSCSRSGRFSRPDWSALPAALF